MTPKPQFIIDSVWDACDEISSCWGRVRCLIRMNVAVRTCRVADYIVVVAMLPDGVKKLPPLVTIPRVGTVQPDGSVTFTGGVIPW